MKAIRTMAILVVIGLGITTAAIAQDSTTTTNQAPALSVFVGVPGVAGVQVGGPPAPGPGGCTTSNSTTTNDQTGATRSTTATNC